MSVTLKLYANYVEKGSAKFTANVSTTSYVYFEAPVTYVDQTAIDQIFLQIVLSNTSKDADPNSVLLVDAFEFNYQPLPTNITYNTEVLNVYNTASEIIFSEAFTDINLFNVSGINQLSYKNATKAVSTNSLNAGMYVLTYQYNNTYDSKKIFVTK